MITPELKAQRDAEEALREVVRSGIDQQLNGLVSRNEARRYWLAHLESVPLDTLAEVLATHLPTTQTIEHQLMKDLLRQKPAR
ncbi:hypothetical protein J3Q00_11330 [Pseudomonas sp. D2-3]